MTDDTTTDQLPTQIAPSDRLLTAAELQNLADVPPEVEWTPRNTPSVWSGVVIP